MKSDPAKIPSHSRWPILLAVFTAGMGLYLSLHFRSRIEQTETNTARLTAETLRLNTERELNLFTEVLESVRALHALSDAVNQEAMDEFIKKGLIHQHAVLGAFGLAQQISQPLRIKIEAREKQGPGAYDVVQMGPSNRWVSAKQKPTYYPLTWQSRTGALNIPIGFDFASQPEALKAISRINHTRRTTLIPVNLESKVKSRRSRDSVPTSHNSQSPPTSNLQPQTFPPSYWVFAPIIPRQAPNIVIGFAVATLDLEPILKRVAALYSPAPTLQLKLSHTDSEEIIHRKNGVWFYQHPLKAIDAQWIFECSLPLTATGHRSMAALVIGLIITALITSQLLILGTRTRKIETEVRVRTEDLRIANVHLEENLHERARMEEEMNELAARERRKIGRDLHDSLGQKLTGAVFLSRSLLNHFKQEESERHSHAKTLNETLKSTVRQVRNMARGLASITLNDESLKESLQQLAEEMTALYNIPCETHLTGSAPSLDRKTKEQLYFIAREAVNNAARHARAKRITIRLDGDDSAWTLRIKDDGSGLPEGKPIDEGMGLRIMRHRAHRIGAQFSITSAPNQGTCITVENQTS